MKRSLISKISILVLIILVIILGFALNKGTAQSDLSLLVKEGKPLKAARPLYVPDEIIVKFKPGVDKNLINDLKRTQGVLEKYESRIGKFKVLKIPKEKTVPQLVEIFKASPLVEYAEPNYYAYATMVPNDPLYQYQWHFDNPTYGGIQTEQAWSINTGNSSVVVAVVDTGVAYENYPAPGHWHIDTYRAYGGTGNSWWCGLNNPSWVSEPGYGNGWKDYLQHTFNLTTATGTVTLTYYYRHDLEVTRGVAYDKAYTEVSTDEGSTWTVLKTYTGKSKVGAVVSWKSETLDLTSYKGKNILLRFRVYSDETYSDEDGYFDSDGAFFVDEIKITDGPSTLFYDSVESGPGTWEITKYQKAVDLGGTNFWVNSDEQIGDANGDGYPGIAGNDDDGDGLIDEDSEGRQPGESGYTNDLKDDDDENGYIDDIKGWDFINSDAHPNDDEAHGTHVTGTIAQTTNNYLGVAGVAFNTTIMPVKVLDAAGSGTYQQVADGIYYAVDNGAKIINMSLGGSAASTTLENAVAYAYNNGVTILAAAGNDNSSTLIYPAAYDAYVIAVGATQYDQTRAPYSNYGPSLDIVAPGGNTGLDQNADGYADGVLQNTFGNTPVDWAYWFYQGTSMATPHVSGVAALLLAQYSTLTPDQIRNYLQSRAEDLGTLGRDNTYGWGLVDAYNTLASVLSVSVSPNTWPLGIVSPGQIIPTTEANDITVTNTGSLNETFTLNITLDGSSWLPGLNAGVDRYVMWGLFCGSDDTPSTSLFKEEDIILLGEPTKATDYVFGDASLSKNGVNVVPSDSRDLWFKFQAPTETADKSEQSIKVTVGAQQP